MITHPSRLLIAASAALLLATPGLLRAETVAQDQQEIKNFLPANITLITAKPAALATAVAQAVAAVSGTNGNPSLSGTATNPDGLTLNGLTTAALQPIVAVANHVRKDRNTVAGTIVTAVIGQINTQNDPTFNADTANLTDAAVDVNSPSTLSAAGKGATVKAAVAAVSDLGTGKYAALTSLATKLSADINLTTTNLETGLTGVTGTKHLNALASAPDAAAAFGKGLGSVTPVNLAVILKGVSVNTRIDNFFAYGAAVASSTNQVAIGSALIKSYPKAVAQITQGLAASLTSGTASEPNRVAFAGKIAVAPNTSKQTVAIIKGLAFVDPYYADQFTSAVFAAVTGTGSTLTAKAFAAEAAVTAKTLGSVLGADGAELTHIANVFAQQINSGKLPVGSAASYAIDLIGGAVKGSVAASPTDVGYGGKLVLSSKTTVTPSVTNDLASIADILVNSVLTSPFVAGTRPGSTAALVAAIGADVVNFIKNAKISTSSNYVAAFIAGTIANEVKALAGANASTILPVLQRAIEAKTIAAVDAAVTLAINGNSSQFPYLGTLTVQETPVTNL